MSELFSQSVSVGGDAYAAGGEEAMNFAEALTEVGISDDAAIDFALAAALFHSSSRGVDFVEAIAHAYGHDIILRPKDSVLTKPQ